MATMNISLPDTLKQWASTQKGYSNASDYVRELIRREQQCCAFLEFELHAEDDIVRLVVTAPEEAREAAELVFEPFQSKAPATSAASCRCNSDGAQ